MKSSFLGRLAITAVAGLILVWLRASAASPEAYATLTGVVQDSSDALIPAATLTLSQTRQNRVWRTRSDSTGAYTLRRVPPGVYRLEVEAPGFQTFVRRDLSLNSAQVAEINVTLELGTVGQTVEVTAKAPPLEGEPETPTRNNREVLEIREVRESSARDVGEALARLEGLSKVRRGGIANDIVLRGFQQENINVLIDGQRIHGACPNNMDPPAFHVDFAEVKKVEITKGAFDMRNQGSLGGAVYVTSKEPPEGIRVTPGFSAGSYGYYNPSVAGSFSNGKVRGLGGYAYRTSEPFLDGRGKRFTDYANYSGAGRQRQAFDIQTGWFKLGAALTENQSLDLSYTRQRSGEALYPYLQMDGIYDDADRASAAYLRRDLGGAISQVRLDGYFTQVRHWMTDEHRTSSGGAPRDYGMATSAGTKTLGGRAEMEIGDFHAGAEVYRRDWNAVTMLRMGGYAAQPSVPDVTMAVGGFFGQYRHSFSNRLQLFAGGRLDAASSEARSKSLDTNLYWAYKGARSRSASDTEPSGGVWITYGLSKSLELFVGMGHTSRLPDAQERFFALRRMGSDWVGNPELRPVENTEGDAGLNFRGRWFSFRPTVFYSRLANYIAVHDQPRVNSVPMVMNAMARSYANTAARLYGGEFSYSLTFSRALMLSGGASYTRGSQRARPDLKIRDTDLAEMPPLKGRTALRYGNRRFFAEVEGFAAAAQKRVNSDLREDPTAGYGILHIKTGIHTGSLNLAVGVDNIFDRFYYESFSYQRDPFRFATRVPEPGRNFYFTISYNFDRAAPGAP